MKNQTTELDNNIVPTVALKDPNPREYKIPDNPNAIRNLVKKITKVGREYKYEVTYESFGISTVNEPAQWCSGGYSGHSDTKADAEQSIIKIIESMDR
jgi:hypothetical protein